MLINLVELIQAKPDVVESLGKAISFELILEPDPDGRGNSLKVIPKINDKWTDGLNLGDIKNSPKLQPYVSPDENKETKNLKRRQRNE